MFSVILRDNMAVVEIPKRISEEDLSIRILDAGAVYIRDISAGEKLFLYSSGNFGPGYVNIKGLVGRQAVFKTLTEQCALKLIDEEAKFDFIAANATGGMVFGHQVREDYQRITGREVPYIYVRNTRKIGGYQEYSTGLTDNPEIPVGSNPLIFEELVNFAQTTCNSRLVLAEEGYPATHAGTILHYENPEAIARLQQANLTLIALVHLKTVLEVAEATGRFSDKTVVDYREFLQNPNSWHKARGFKRVDLGNE